MNFLSKTLTCSRLPAQTTNKYFPKKKKNYELHNISFILNKMGENFVWYGRLYHLFHTHVRAYTRMRNIIRSRPVGDVMKLQPVNIVYQ